MGMESDLLILLCGKVRRVYNEHSDALIWRFANQSIWGDVLQELQGRVSSPSPHTNCNR